MPRFEPKNPDYRAIAAATFDRQQAMRTLGISISRLEAGEAGIITAGLDTACGIAAFTLMPPDCDILTVEFKTNLLAPARGESFAFRALVIKPGRTLTVCEAQAFAQTGGSEILIATMTGTLMALVRRM
jgi:acyl-coenzyme A thioesterase PaaI-like protein